MATKSSKDEDWPSPRSSLIDSEALNVLIPWAIQLLLPRMCTNFRSLYANQHLQSLWTHAQVFIMETNTHVYLVGQYYAIAQAWLSTSEGRVWDYSIERLTEVKDQSLENRNSEGRGRKKSYLWVLRYNLSCRIPLISPAEVDHRRNARLLDS